MYDRHIHNPLSIQLGSIQKKSEKNKQMKCKKREVKKKKRSKSPVFFLIISFLFLMYKVIDIF